MISANWWHGNFYCSSVPKTPIRTSVCTQKYLHKHQGFQVRDNSTWVKHRNKKSHTEKGRKFRFTKPSSLDPKPGQPSQKTDIFFTCEVEESECLASLQTPELADPNTRLILTTTGGSLQASTNPGPSLTLTATSSSDPSTTHDTSFQRASVN